MSNDHISVEINGVLYVKLEDARKLREGWDKADAEIEKLRMERNALRVALETIEYLEPRRIAIQEAIRDQLAAALGEKE